MAAYATLQELVDAFGAVELQQLLCDEDRLLTEALFRAALADDTSAYSQVEQDVATAALARANAALQKQTNFIDGKIMGRYQLPLITPANTSVGECCLALTRAALADDGDNISTTIKEERKHWRDWLREVAQGSAFLPGEVVAGSGGSVQQRKTGTICSGIDWATH